MISEGEFLGLGEKTHLKLFTFEWRKDYRKFNKLYLNGEWDSAIEQGELIVKTESKDRDFFQQLAICYRKVHKNYEAEYYMRKSLEFRTKKNIAEIIQTIDNTMFLGEKNISSKYVYLGGRFNLEYIEHSYKVGRETKKCLTKIIPNESTSKFKAHKEKFFNLIICKRFPQFQSITPKLTNYYEMKTEEIYLITFNKMNNDKIDEIDLKEIINISENIISSIKYDEGIRLLKVVDRGKRVPLEALMHKPSTHKLIIGKMKNKIKDFEDDIDLKIIEKIKHIIIDLKSYEKIDPKKDYVFSHKDFSRNNILYDKEKDKYYIIDWVNYGLALEGADLVRFFISSNFTFREIEEEYLDKMKGERDALMVKKIFFLYSLLILWVKHLNRDNLQKQIHDHIYPAVQYMEGLIENKEEYNQ